MSLAKVDGAVYGQQLSAKADRLRSKFSDFSLPELEVFDSQTEHYRMRSDQLVHISPLRTETAPACMLLDSCDSITAGQNSGSGMKVLKCTTSCLKR